MHIAKKYLVPKQLSLNGLKQAELAFTDQALHEIIRHYTREAGVRNLERDIANVCRKVVKKFVTKQKLRKVNVVRTSVEQYLGVQKFMYGVAEKNNQIGQVTGLAWTQVGGELLTIEAAMMPGKGKVSHTGQLGDVMKESIHAAMTVIRSRAKQLGLSDDFYDTHDFHVHVPEGATPKDGPSAGIGMCTVLASVVTQVPVRADVAMTGEITLRGQVLPIGGLKEKLLAAHRGGIKEVLIPQDNKKDLTDIPDNILKKLKIHCVTNIEEVLGLALQHNILQTVKESSKKQKNTKK